MLQDQESVRFGLYTADLHAAELRRGQDHVPLQNLPFRILTVLLREPGRVVTREELRRELWPEDTFVDFERGISTAVSKLRDALGDTASNPRFIETVGRRGYRFIAPVTLLTPERPREFGVSNGTDEKTTSPANPKVRETLPAPASVQIANVKTGRRRIIYLLLVLAAVAALAATWNAVLRRSSQAASHREIMSIAVLPLENLSGDPQQEYLSDGLTDAVTNLLAQIGNLRVISRTTAMHYKHSGKTAPEIAKELGVDALVEGSVMRSGDHLRLTIQLVQASKDRDLWANSYERELEDVLSLERELSREIAGQIRVQLTPEQQDRLAQKRTVDPESYTLYLQGRYYWHQRSEQSLIKAIGYFEQAIARDPTFAPAYAGLADSYVVLPFFMIPPPDGYQRARLSAEKALALDPGLAEAHNSVAYVRIYHDWNFSGAEEEFKKAIALNPNYATAHQWYAELLSIEGRNQEAIAEIQRALNLDPQSAIMHHQAGQILRSARQYPQALDEYHKSLELDPNLMPNYFSMYLTYRRTGDYKRAIDAAVIHSKMMSDAYKRDLLQAAEVFNTRGKEAFLQRSAKLWEGIPGLTPPYYEVLDRAELHQWNQCLQLLEREYKRHNPIVLNAKTDPELDPLRSDPRFQALLRKIGLP
jgi:TolB-like protein/DNA-binding winged helix-turn-helix (wHTH) protein/Tfp pilus assembly protein PilF